LSERKGDIYLLASHFLEKYQRSPCCPVLQISPEARALFEAYPWPGNVRELDHVIHTAVYLTEGELLLPEHLLKRISEYQRGPATVLEKPLGPKNEQRQSVDIPLDATFEAMEEMFIRATLKWLDENRTKAANVLRIGIRTLQRKLKKYGV